MPNRATIVSALAVIVPVLVVLIAVVALARPQGDAQPAASPSDAMLPKLVPTAASAAQPAAQQPGASAPTVPAPRPRPNGPAAPGFDGGGAWVNSDPLDLAQLGAQGKVVLVDFWTFGCYNCTNTLPYVKQW